MITEKEFNHVKDTIFSLVNFEFNGKISTYGFDGIKVDYDGENAKIGCKDKSSLARALFILAKDSPKGAFSVEEKIRFKYLGIMLDVARNRVMRVESVKRYIDYLAALGFNSVMLYLEDVFHMEKYPRFGYMRGRYEVEDLKAIDDYAYELGVEVIPNIESLGHMEQYLRWNEADPIKDTNKCLLVGVPETYEFLDEMLKTMRMAFRSDRIHLNIDETQGLGTGAYAKKFGNKEGNEILYDHLEKLDEIVRKYNYQPIMSSDMFFRKLSPTGGYYSPASRLTKEMVERVPDNMTICYWDYYHTEKKDYDYFMEEHKVFERPIQFYGSVWTWEGLIEDTEFTHQVSVPAMLSCLEHGVDDVFITMWGDDGGETNPMHTISTLPIYTEMYYKGRECSVEELDEVSEFLTGVKYSDKLEVSKLHGEIHLDKFFSKRIFYADIMYDLVDFRYDYEKYMQGFREAYEHTMSRKNDYFEYCNLYAKCILGKNEILHDLRNKYKADDREYLKELCESKLPELISDYIAFQKVFTKQWLKDSKGNGLEVLEVRFGGAILRLETAIDRINAYLNGEIDKIEELEEEVVLSESCQYKEARKVMGTSFIW